MSNAISNVTLPTRRQVITSDQFSSPVQEEDDKADDVVVHAPDRNGAHEVRNTTDNANMVLIPRSPSTANSENGRHLQLLRLRRLASNDEDFGERKAEMLEFFRRRLYPEQILKAAVTRVKGLGDNRLDQVADVQQFITAIKNAIASNPSGYHAILFVIRYSVRYTKEEVDTVKKLKQILGDDFIRNHCILVLTCGDNFESDPVIEEENLTFNQWVCRQQEPHFRDLVAECGSRVLLFDNRTKDEAKKIQQITTLIQTIDALNANGLRYTNREFQEAERERERLVTLLGGRPYLKEEHLKELGIITFSLSKIQMVPQDLDDLQKLRRRATNLYSKIKEDDKDTGVLNSTMRTVSNVVSGIDQQIEKLKLSIVQAEKVAEEKRNLEAMLTKLTKEKERYKMQLKPEVKHELKQKEDEMDKVKKRLKQLKVAEKAHSPPKKQAAPVVEEKPEEKLKRKQEFDNLKKTVHQGLREGQENQQRREEEKQRLVKEKAEIKRKQEEIQQRREAERNKLIAEEAWVKRIKEEIEKQEKERSKAISEAKKTIDRLEKEYQQLKREELKKQGLFSSLFNFLSNLSGIRSIESYFKTNSVDRTSI